MFCLDFGCAFLMEEEDWIIVEQHVVNTVHSIRKGAVPDDGTFAGPVFLSQVGHFLNWGCFLEGLE